MIEHELLAEQILIEGPDQENEIRRITGVNGVKAPPPKHFERVGELPE